MSRSTGLRLAKQKPLSGSSCISARNLPIFGHLRAMARAASRDVNATGPCGSQRDVAHRHAVVGLARSASAAESSVARPERPRTILCTIVSSRSGAIRRSPAADSDGLMHRTYPRTAMDRRLNRPCCKVVTLLRTSRHRDGSSTDSMFRRLIGVLKGPTPSHLPQAPLPQSPRPTPMVGELHGIPDIAYRHSRAAQPREASAPSTPLTDPQSSSNSNQSPKMLRFCESGLRSCRLAQTLAPAV